MYFRETLYNARAGVLLHLCSRELHASARAGVLKFELHSFSELVHAVAYKRSPISED